MLVSRLTLWPRNRLGDALNDALQRIATPPNSIDLLNYASAIADLALPYR